MQLTSSYFAVAAGGSLALIPDPVISTPPLALNAFHLVHPDGRRLRHVTVGPVVCTQPEPQKVTMCVWAWTGFGWELIHDGIDLWAQNTMTGNRADSVTLDVPAYRGLEPVGWASALCVIPRASLVANGAYEIFIGATDAPRWPC